MNTSPTPTQKELITWVVFREFSGARLRRVGNSERSGRAVLCRAGGALGSSFDLEQRNRISVVSCDDERGTAAQRSRPFNTQLNISVENSDKSTLCED